MKHAQDRRTETDDDDNETSVMPDVAGPSAAPAPEERAEIPRGELSKDVLLNSWYPREMLPPKSQRRPFSIKAHREKLTFFKTSPYDLPKIAKSLRFWDEEQEIYYAEKMC